MKLEHNVSTFIYSSKAIREALIVRAGEYKVVKRETNKHNEVYVWLESVSEDGTVMTSAPLITKTWYGLTELGKVLGES
jgi:hypothetical protein